MFFPTYENAVLGVSPWWSSALAGDVGSRCLVIAAAGVVLLAVLLRAGWVLRRGASPRGGVRAACARLRGESGTATVEFVLVFGPALLICLVLLQAVLMFTANLFVNYAAYAATRSAIVRAATGAEGGGGELAYGSDEFIAVRRAAAYALTPVSGKMELIDQSDFFVRGLDGYFDNLGVGSPRWVDSLAGQRLAYAFDSENTELTLYETTVSDDGRTELTEIEGRSSGGQVLYGPKDPVTIGVTHRLHLSVPYVGGLLFGDGTHPTLGGESPYATVTATCTLTLEGYDRNLPPEPEVEREP